MSGIRVNRQNVLEITAVYSAVQTIGRTMASLPFALYQKTDRGSEEAKRHPCYYVTRHEPAPYTTGFSFRQAMFARACLGDAIALIERNGVGRPKKFTILDNCTPTILEDGRQVYVLSDLRTGQFQSVLYPWEVIHLKPLTLDGFKGVDVVDTHAETFGISLAATRYGGSFFGNGAHVSGVIETPNSLGPDGLKKLREQWNARYSGVSKTGTTAVLDNGMSYKKVGMTPNEAGMNETRTFQVRETARIFGMPLHLFQDLGDTTFNNVESMSTQFVTLCLRPWAVQTEQEFAMKTLTESERMSGDYFYHFNLEGLLRGDTKTRGDFYTKLRNIGVMNANEIREKENLNRREDPGGDTYFEPMNMQGPDNSNNNDAPAEGDSGEPATDTPAAAAPVTKK